MKSLSLSALTLIVASLISSPLAAQPLGFSPPSASSHAVDPNQFVSTPQLGYHPPSASSHAVDPNQFLSTAATGPLQQQMQQNYATELMGAQRDLLQQNPSGVTRPELAIGNALNGYTGPR
jgi:hypothetical protein